MPRGQPLAARLLHHAQRDDITGCLVWQGATNRGYGVFIDEHGQRDKAHRVSFRLFVRPIEAGECVLHDCDNRSCIEPTHLFAGTKGDNNRDRHMKGRSCNQHTGTLGDRTGGLGVCKDGRW